MPNSPQQPGNQYVADHAERLRQLIDAIVPEDDYPSASEAGGLDFLAAMLNERPDWIPQVDAVMLAVDDAGLFGTLDADARARVLDGLAGFAAYDWFVRLVNGGYYADARNGGNAGARSWEMVGWRPAPAGGWPDLPPHDSHPRFVTADKLLGAYDAIVVGSGAGGGVAAAGLSEAGRNVLVVEAGGWPTTEALSWDHLRNPRSSWGLEQMAGPSDHGNPRVIEAASGPQIVRPSDGAWANNAMTAGGGTRVYGAQAWRFAPKDFAMASTYGVPEGSDLADWPLGYDEMEPYYERAEWELGVSGDPTLGKHAGRQRRPYPMAALKGGIARDILAGAAETIGYGTLAVPLLVNSTPWLGRPACARCAQCIGFECPIGAKNSSLNLLERAFATGRTVMITNTTAERVLADASGRVVGVALVGLLDGQVWRREVRSGEVVLSAGAIETARLLLNSPSAREPQGLGNNHDQVGRRLQGHVYGGAAAIFEDVVEDLAGPGPAIATTDFRHGNADIIGGGILANEFVVTPSNGYRYLVDGGLLTPHGIVAKQGMRHLLRRLMRVMGPIQEVTSADARVRIDTSVRDRFGIPVARLSGDVHPEDIRGRDFLSKLASEWLEAAGARRISPFSGPRRPGPSGGQHQAGTCRMGNDPASSVTDPYGRVWGHDNLRIADGSLHVTNGGVNPVLTIFANSMRIIDHMVGRKA